MVLIDARFICDECGAKRQCVLSVERGVVASELPLDWIEDAEGLVLCAECAQSDEYDTIPAAPMADMLDEAPRVCW